MMPATDREVESGTLLRVAQAADIVNNSGVCQHPVALTGSRLLVEADTGRVLHRLDAKDLPEQTVTVRCRNRRAVVCPACSALYKLDAFHLISAGLRGGKDVPAQVADRPRLFVTLTAPSFGKVHTGPGTDVQPRHCHPARRNPGNGCGRWHRADDLAIGTPVDPAGYDYAGQVLFNAHAGVLWARLTIAVRRALAQAGGLSRRQAHAQVRVVFAKVAEFQIRGSVHFHAIVRLDGADGPGSPPPSWATAGLLEMAIRQAVKQVRVSTPDTPILTARSLGWGRQIDIQYLHGGDGDLSDLVIARYIAKYATKAAETAGVSVPPLYCRACDGTGARTTDAGKQWLCRTCSGTGRRPGIRMDGLSGHGWTLVDTCWRLGGQHAMRHLRLRRWAHQLGYRGHFTTKSRTYSTTFAALRAERRDWSNRDTARRLGLDPDVPFVVIGDWRYAGHQGIRA
jgi:Replication initiator protein, pSAM2